MPCNKKANVNPGEWLVAEPTPPALVSSLLWCAQKQDLACSQCLHSQIVESGFDHRPELIKHLVQVHARCGALHDASALFASREHNVGLFSVLLQEYARHSQDDTAHTLFHHMQQEGFLPSKAVYVSILSLCAARKNVIKGKRLHSTILSSSSFDGDAVLYTALMNMYGKCGCIHESRKIFDTIVPQDVVCWTSMISIYANNGQSFEALQVFCQMQQAEASPNEATFVSVLKACVCLGDVITGQAIHHLIFEYAVELHIAGGNALIHLYARCGSVADAERTFETMSRKDVGTWNAVISFYTTHNLGVEALVHFVKMLESGLIPNNVTFISVLPICESSEMLVVGKWLHSLILDLDLESDNMVCNALLAMYGKCNCLEMVQEVLREMPSPDVVSWNTLISIYSQQGSGDDAFKQVKQMELEGVLFDKVTFVLVLALCGSHDMLRMGEQVHASIWNNRIERDLVVGNALISMYSRCGNLKHVWMVLDNIPVRDVFSYSPIINMSIKQGKINHAFQTFEQLMQEGLLPGKTTYRSMFSACATYHMLTAGRQMHAYVESCSLASDLTIVNALLSMYNKIGNWLDAWVVFETASGRDRVSWNTMLTSCTYHGFGHKAAYMFNQMKMEGELPDRVTVLATLSACGHVRESKEGKLLHACIACTELSRDVIVGNALVNMYGKCGRVKDAETIFTGLIDSNEGFMTTWNVMISVYAIQGQGKDALQLFYQMQQCGVLATPFTFVSILSACTSVIGLAEGIMMHARIEHSGFEKVTAVENALINMYGKWGDMTAAQRVFDSMPVQDLISWTTVITNYAHHGQISEALHHYKLMKSKGLIPNHVTLLSMLNGYSHTGLLDSCFGFVSETEDASLAISDHFVSIIDLLVRAGQMEEARQLTKMSPVEPNIAMYMTLLAGSRQKTHIEHMEYAARRVFELDPENSAAHIMLSNVYMAGDRGEET